GAATIAILRIMLTRGRRRGGRVSVRAGWPKRARSELEVDKGSAAGRRKPDHCEHCCRQGADEQGAVVFANAPLQSRIVAQELREEEADEHEAKRGVTIGIEVCQGKLADIGKDSSRSGEIPGAEENPGE